MARYLTTAASTVKGALSRMADPVLDWMAIRYQAAVGKELKKYGLRPTEARIKFDYSYRYDDLYDPLMDLDVGEALKRMPKHEQEARNQRLYRAVDLSLKHEELPKELQALQTPFQPYLQSYLADVKDELKERAVLDSETPYERQLP